MKGILIDPAARTIGAVEVGQGIDVIYAVLDCSTFTALEFDAANTLWLDDEGLFREGQDFFAWGDFPQPLAGKCLILGVNAEGESVDVTVPMEHVTRNVRWLSPQEVVDMATAAARAAHAAAAEAERTGSGFIIVSMPQVSIDPETGKARAE